MKGPDLSDRQQDECEHDFRHLRESVSQGTDTFFCARCLCVRKAPGSWLGSGRPAERKPACEATMRDVDALVCKVVGLVDEAFDIPKGKRSELENETYDKLSLVLQEFLQNNS